jgi:hypothetical protein
MNEYNNVDCCFDCKKQLNNDLCKNYCFTKEFCNDGRCIPGGCPNFASKFNVVISKEEYEELLEYKRIYLDLCK